MNSDALAYLAEKGLSLEEIVEFARLSERKVDRTNADRQARYREKRKVQKAEKVTRYSNGVTPPIDNNHTPSPDISSDEESQSQRDEPAAVLESWNEMAKPLGLPTARQFTGNRLKACKARLRDHGLSAIQAAIRRIPQSAFLRGDAGNWNGANLTFFFRPDTVTKILEGEYDDRKQNRHGQDFPQRNGHGHDRRSTLARVIDEGLDFLG